VGDQVSHPYKTKGIIIHMYVLFFMFLDIYLLQDITICPVEGGGGLKSIFLEQ
jgi:hypothetical protein